MAEARRRLSAGSEPLTRLAAHYGIEPSFTDAFGRHREVAPTTLCALLAAMGCAVDTPGAIATSLREIATHPWRELVGPVRVATVGRPLGVPLQLDAAHGGSLEWRLLCDDGSVREGRTAVERLAVVETARFGSARYQRRIWRPRVRLPVGTHRVDFRLAGGPEGAREGDTRLIITPPRCFGFADLGRDQAWGVAAQLYGLRSPDDWGIGDFGDLARLAEGVAGHGAACVGVNPLHALFPADPNHVGPYSPSNRLFLNVLYIDVEAVPELAETPAAHARVAEPAFQRRLAAERAKDLVDYPAVAALKMPVLERLYATFRERHLARPEGSRRGAEYRAFTIEMGEMLRRQSCFEALHEQMLKSGGPWSWFDWPPELRDPETAAVAEFATRHAERVEFFSWLQWVADQQLAEAQRRACAAGMPIGLYRDLAVAVNPAGGMAWANPGITMHGVTVGAPPDLFNPKGQNWGLAPLSPVALQARAYRPFLDDLGQNMRHAGAIRIDHAMGLMRLYWVPEGASPAEGAYVRYPLADLVRLAALQSHRQRCLVVGEDLGTVAPGFRQAMQRAGIMSYRVLYFERTRGGGFKPPEACPTDALITVSTHDLPTLAGFWAGRDLEWRDRVDLHPNEAERARLHDERVRDRRQLIAALKRAGLLDEEVSPEDQVPEALLLAAPRFLARAPSRLMMLQLEDVLGEVEQANLPGTLDEHPNWRRRLPLEVEAVAAHPVLAELARALAAAGRSWRG